MAIRLAFGWAKISPTGTIVHITDARANVLAGGVVGVERFTCRISEGPGRFDTATAGIAVQ